MTNSRAAASSGPRGIHSSFYRYAGNGPRQVCTRVCACVPYTRGRPARACGFYYCIFTLSRLFASTRARSTSRPIEHLQPATPFAPSFPLDLSAMAGQLFFSIQSPPSVTPSPPLSAPTRRLRIDMLLGKPPANRNVRSTAVRDFVIASNPT